VGLSAFLYCLDSFVPLILTPKRILSLRRVCLCFCLSVTWQCGASVAYFSVGYAFSFGVGSNPNGFIGTTNFFLMGVDDYAFWMFQYAFSAASATIVAGTLAERSQMVAYLCYSVLLAGFVYPVVAHAIWSSAGFLSAHNTTPLFGSGVIDFAGGGVVHLTGGSTALYATTILGPRRGRFHDDEGRRLDKPKVFQGHSIALQVRTAKERTRWRMEGLGRGDHSRVVVLPLLLGKPQRCWVRSFSGLAGTVSMPGVP
jgi:ammonia channel protein AmtB